MSAAVAPSQPQNPAKNTKQSFKDRTARSRGKASNVFGELMAGELLWNAIERKSKEAPGVTAVLVTVPEPAIHRSWLARQATIQSHREAAEKQAADAAKQERRLRGSSNASAFSMHSMRQKASRVRRPSRLSQSQRPPQQPPQQPLQPRPLTLDQIIRRSQQNGRGVEASAKIFLRSRNNSAAVLSFVGEINERPKNVHRAKSAADITRSDATVVAAAMGPADTAAKERDLRLTKSATELKAGPSRDSGLGPSNHTSLDTGRTGSVAMERPSTVSCGALSQPPATEVVDVGAENERLDQAIEIGSTPVMA